jgi:6,7-dimethyl-8-ribityllumazine synthase
VTAPGGGGADSGGADSGGGGRGVRRIALAADWSPEDSGGPGIVIVVSRTNEFVTERLLEGALAELRSHGIAHVTVLDVAGAFELVPAAAGAFAAGAEGVVALGAVIRGQTPHFEFVAGAATDGLTALAAAGRPVAFGVLTAENVAQAMERAGGALGNKGAEAVLALLQLLSGLRRLRVDAS